MTLFFYIWFCILSTVALFIVLSFVLIVIELLLVKWFSWVIRIITGDTTW